MNKRELLPNTYNEETIDQLGLDWDEYEDAMQNYRDEQLSDDLYLNSDPYIQRGIRNWNPSDPADDVNTVEHWLQ